MHIPRFLPRHLWLAAFIHRRCRPVARAGLARWEARARHIPDPDIRTQALMSLQTKGFHCEGGAVYGAGASEQAANLVPAIVAFQTLVDCLDNLSDRCGTVTEATLRRLHSAVADALTPGAPPRAYARGDGGYLAELVSETQVRLAALPGYSRVADACRTLGARYAELQVRKHLPARADREPALREWLSQLLPAHPGWEWWELAAACGSTLGIFALLTSAARADAPGAGPLLAAYFPLIGGLHILLDYYIDQAEDLDGGDFNLVGPYGGGGAAERALRSRLAEARRAVRGLPEPALHAMVVTGLPGLYLSDPKVARQGFGPGAHQILRGGGVMTRVAYWYCRAMPPIR